MGLPKGLGTAPASASKTFTIGPAAPRGEIIGIYGPGGAGKTMLACLIERATGKPVGFIDLDDSLSVLDDQLAELGLSPQRVSGIASHRDLVEALESTVFDGMGSIVIDTMTDSERMMMAHVINTVPDEKGGNVKSIEGYGYGKGYRHLHEAWLDVRYQARAHAQQGRNVIFIMHDTIAKVPNPEGDDYIRHEPAMYQDSQVSLRRSLRDTCDHLFYIGYDIQAIGAKRGEKHGKAVGSGTRTIYCVETATCMAKSRRLSGSIPYSYGDDALWRALFNIPTTEN